MGRTCHRNRNHRCYVPLEYNNFLSLVRKVSENPWQGGIAHRSSGIFFLVLLSLKKQIARKSNCVNNQLTAWVKRRFNEECVNARGGQSSRSEIRVVPKYLYVREQDIQTVIGFLSHVLHHKRTWPLQSIGITGKFPSLT